MLRPYLDKLVTAANWNCSSPPTEQEKKKQIIVWPLKNLHQNSYLSNNHQYISFAAVKGW